MTIEDIEKAALKGVEEYVNSGNLKGFRGSYCKGFMEGADWRINSVWHDVDKELPEYNRHVVNEDWFDFTAKNEKDLKRIMSQYKFKRWAYIKDLIPTEE